MSQGNLSRYTVPDEVICFKPLN